MPEDKKVIVRKIPPDLEPLTDEEFERAMDQHFDARLIQPERSLQRLCLSLQAERIRVASLRHFVAHAGSNMKRPQAEAKILYIALNIAHDDLVRGVGDQAITIIEKALSDCSLSMAGRKALDFSEWAAIDSAHQHAKPAFAGFPAGGFHLDPENAADPTRSGGVAPPDLRHSDGLPQKTSPKTLAQFAKPREWQGHSVDFESDDEHWVAGNLVKEGLLWGWGVSIHAEGRNEPSTIAEGQEGTEAEAKAAAETAYDRWIHSKENR